MSRTMCEDSRNIGLRTHRIGCVRNQGSGHSVRIQGVGLDVRIQE